MGGRSLGEVDCVCGFNERPTWRRSNYCLPSRFELKMSRTFVIHLDDISESKPIMSIASGNLKLLVCFLGSKSWLIDWYWNRNGTCRLDPLMVLPCTCKANHRTSDASIPVIDDFKCINSNRRENMRMLLIIPLYRFQPTGDPASPLNYVRIHSSRVSVLPSSLWSSSLVLQIRGDRETLPSSNYCCGVEVECSFLSFELRY